MSCLPGMPCYGGGRVVYPRTCGVDPCRAHKTNTDLVFYSGPNLPTLGVNTCDDLTTILERIDYLFSQGVITTTTTTTVSPTTTTTTSSSTSTTTSTSSTSTTSTSSTSTTSTSSTSTTTTSAPVTGLTEAYIILQTGQSNAVGRGISDPPNEVVVPLGAYEYRSSTNAVYALSDPTGIPGDDSQATIRSMNPALTKRMVELTGKPVIVVCAAVGNTNIDSWINPSGTLYTTALARWNAVKAYCVANGITILGEYIHWLQGENDAAIAMATDAYVSRFNTMIDLFRDNFQPDKVFATRIGYNDAGSVAADSNKIMLAQKELNFSKDEVIVSTYSPATFTEGDKALTGNRVHYSVKGLNQVGTEVAEAIVLYQTLNKKPILTEPVVALQDPAGYFDDIYNFRSLNSSIDNTNFNEMFERNNLTLISGTPVFNNSLGLTVSGSTPLNPTTIRELTNAHDWSIEVTFRLDSSSGMMINGRSTSGWASDWLWIMGSSAVSIQGNGVEKQFTSLSGVNFNQLSNLVITYTSATNTTNVYVNSGLVATTTTWSFTSLKLESFLRGYTASPSLPFSGIVERFRVVKKVLSIWEFDRSPNIGTVPAVDWQFPFNGNLNELNGDVTATVKIYSSGIDTTPVFDADGLTFDQSYYFKLGQQLLLDDDFTIEFRAKCTTGSGSQQIFTGGTTPGNPAGTILGIYGTPHSVVQFNFPLSSNNWTLSGGFDTTTYHVYKVVRNATAGTIELFIDGVSQGSAVKNTVGTTLATVGGGNPQGTGFIGTIDYFNAKNSI